MTDVGGDIIETISKIGFDIGKKFRVNKETKAVVREISLVSKIQ